MTGIVVIGASGFVGSPTCAAFAERGHRVRAVTRRPSAALGSVHENVVVGDVAGVTDWRPIVEGATAVVYLAARVHVMHEEAGDALAANRAVNTAAAVAAARAAVTAGVRSFVYVSTIKVHGEHAPPHAPFHADSPYSPHGAYALSKVEAERELGAVARDSGLDVAVVVPPLVYGPGVRANFLRFMRLAAFARRVPLPLRSIRNARSLAYVGNVADVIVRAAERSASGRFLVDDGAAVSTPELLREIATHLGHRARLAPVSPAVLRGAARLVGRGEEIDRLIGSLVIDSSHTRAALAWEPRWTFTQGIERTVAWYRTAEHVDA